MITNIINSLQKERIVKPLKKELLVTLSYSSYFWQTNPQTAS